MTEHLTANNLDLFKDAQEHYGFSKVWTDNCVILTEGSDKKAKRVKRSEVPGRSPKPLDPYKKALEKVPKSDVASSSSTTHANN